jgi:acylphosphatase
MTLRRHNNPKEAHMAGTDRRVHCIVTGIVQGVGFRYYTRDEAMRLGLRGWVRNLDDGNVEVVVEGPEEALQQLVTWLGPLGGRDRPVP